VIDPQLMVHLLDSLAQPYVFCDTGHIIRYMNRPALAHYARRGGASLLGTDVRACHGERSAAWIGEIFDRMQREGLEEQLITDNERWRIYMRAVRDGEGRLLGYYERYEPPQGAPGARPPAVGDAMLRSVPG
jgi:hypothetical protein